MNIPRKAWPMLAIFAPERFMKLQLALESLEPGSDGYNAARTGLETLKKEFMKWAVSFLEGERKLELLSLCGKAQHDSALNEKFWSPRFLKLLELAQADLTATEHERLLRHKIRKTERPVKAVENALMALIKPWKHRDNAILLEARKGLS